jgi:uncharacterized protein (TIGR03085 family)
MTPVAEATLAEHRALADTLTAVGPEAPTLVEGWTSTELAAHLASLELLGGLPLFVGRQLISRVHPRPTEGSRQMAERGLERARAKGYAWCVARARSPHRLPLRGAGGPVAIFEVYVHHQDVLRPADDLPPRAAPRELESSLPWLLAFHGRRLDDVHLCVETDAGAHETGAGAPIVVRGEVGEVVLWLAGRGPHCSVEVEGDAAVLDRLRPVTRI